jgi:adenine-specific DNA-methyltransferase
MPPPTKTSGVKYIGSKNKLIDGLLQTISGLAPSDTEGRTLIDVFSGTTRVAQAFRGIGWTVSTCDLAWATQDYAALFLQTTMGELGTLRVLATELDAMVPPAASSGRTKGWLECTYCDAPPSAPGGSVVRVWQRHNSRKADAVRDRIDAWLGAGRISPLMARRLVALLILALDAVDNTVGVQQAYLKQWCRRSFNELSLVARLPPDDWPGWSGPCATHHCGDALTVVFAPAHVAYVDPPYTTHSYATYYHIWDSLSRWDKPDVVLKTNRRVDRVAAHPDRDLGMVSPWNSRRTALDAFRRLVVRLPVRWVVISYSSDALVSIPDIVSMVNALVVCRGCRVEKVEHTRNVMATIGNGADAGNRTTVTEHVVIIEKVV